jgi:hypothetical protein
LDGLLPAVGRDEVRAGGPQCGDRRAVGQLRTGALPARQDRPQGFLLAAGYLDQFRGRRVPDRMEHANAFAFDHHCGIVGGEGGQDFGGVHSSIASRRGFETVTTSQCPWLLVCDAFESVTGFSGVTLCKPSQCPWLLVCDGVTL